MSDAVRRALLLLGAALPCLLLSRPPEVIAPGEPALVALYNEAWREASARILTAPPGAPVSRYMDENVYDDTIWVWDSCLMACFTDYARADYPGIETLDALYVTLVEGNDSPLKVWHPDNPPLFAWAEAMHFRRHGDVERLKDVLQKRRLLQRHYAWFNEPPSGTLPPGCGVPVQLTRKEAPNGAWGWSWGVASGMDNTPRGLEAGFGGILWIDAIAQQALSARCIAELLEVLGDPEASFYRAEFERQSRAINTFYWDEQDGFYYDVYVKDGTLCKVRTLASYWPLLAGVVPPERAERLIARLRDAAEFGGERPLNSVSRSAPGYHAQTGEYWRGAVWLPMAYVTLKALDRAGERELADSLALRVLKHQLRTFEAVEPHTIWECYAPEADRPSTEYGNPVRGDFCGWSALGPINLFLEHVIGLRDYDAATRTLTWEPPATWQGSVTIRGLEFGGVTFDLVYDGTAARVEHASAPITLRFRAPTSKESDHD